MTKLDALKGQVEVTAGPGATIELVIIGHRGRRSAHVVQLHPDQAGALAEELNRLRGLALVPGEAYRHVAGYAAVNPARHPNDPALCECGDPRYVHAVPAPEECLQCACSGFRPQEATP